MANRKIPQSVMEGLESRITECEYWASRLWRWVREISDDIGNEVANSVLVHLIRKNEGGLNEARVAIAEKADEAEVDVLRNQVALLVTQMDGLKTELAALKSKRGKKAWPVKFI